MSKEIIESGIQCPECGNKKFYRIPSNNPAYNHGSAWGDTPKDDLCSAGGMNFITKYRCLECGNEMYIEEETKFVRTRRSLNDNFKISEITKIYKILV